MTLDDVYLGNPLLKKANVAQEFTKEQILELQRKTIEHDKRFGKYEMM